MYERLSLRWYSAQQAHQSMLGLWAWAKPLLIAGHRLVISARGETRSLAQNNLMWSCLTDLSKQVKWFGKNLTPEGWKDFITGHLHGQELVPNMDGTGFISINRGRLFPAHAGMNRMPGETAASVVAVPRARGDEPEPASNSLQRLDCSPRTRG